MLALREAWLAGLKAGRPCIDITSGAWSVAAAEAFPLPSVKIPNEQTDTQGAVWRAYEDFEGWWLQYRPRHQDAWDNLIALDADGSISRCIRAVLTYPVVEEETND